MGCASSSPFVTTGNGVLTAAKGAATDAVHAGEGALNDVKDTLNEKVGHVKEAVIGAVQNVGHGIENAFTNGKKDIQSEINPENLNNLTAEQTLDNMNEKINATIIDPADKMIDDALDDIGETIDDQMHITKNMMTDVTENIQNSQNNMEKLVSDYTSSSPMHSIDMDSLKTTSPEPEIENALSNNDLTNPPTPRPTYSELEHLQDDIIDGMTATINKNNVEIMKTFQNQHITESQAAIIREGAAAAAAASTAITTGNDSRPASHHHHHHHHHENSHSQYKRPTPTNQKRIIRRTRIPNINRNYYQSNTNNSLPLTRWEKRHDKLIQIQNNDKVRQQQQEEAREQQRRRQLRQSSAKSIWSGNSDDFTRPRTMYLIFGNNFLKTPKIKIIDVQHKATRWMMKPKQESYELDLYTGIKTKTLNNEPKTNQTSHHYDAATGTAASVGNDTKFDTRRNRKSSIINLEPATTSRWINNNKSNSNSGQLQKIVTSSPTTQQQQTFQKSKTNNTLINNSHNNAYLPQSNNNDKVNDKFQFLTNTNITGVGPEAEDDDNSSVIRKQRTEQWLKNNLLDFQTINAMGNKLNNNNDKLHNGDNKNHQLLFNSNELAVEEKQYKIEKFNEKNMNNNGENDIDRKIRIDGFLDDFHELKKGHSITKFRKHDNDMHKSALTNVVDSTNQSQAQQQQQNNIIHFRPKSNRIINKPAIKHIKSNNIQTIKNQRQTK